VSLVIHISLQNTWRFISPNSENEINIVLISIMKTQVPLFGSNSYGMIIISIDPENRLCVLRDVIGKKNKSYYS
jgi:hypothetical protein